MEASRRYGSKEFQNKIKSAQNYKRIYDPRGKGVVHDILHWLHLDNRLYQFLLLIVAGFFAYFLIISPYFLVTEFIISGNQQVSRDQIVSVLKKSEEGRWLLVPKNHLALMSKNGTLEMVSSELPLVKEFKTYKRVWPNKIEMEIVERHPGFIFNVNNTNYLVDEEGFVVRAVDDTTGLPIVIDQVIETVTVGEQLNNTKLVAFVISATKQWPNKIRSAMREIKVPGKAAEQVEFKSAEGWGVFFDINRPVEAQLSNLSLILNRQIPAQNRLRLAYIDLRFDKWAYYCYKNSPCEAQPQNTEQTKEEGEEGKVEVE
ncbi:MAG TPA: FtsQ-type POTRA domain-containing protein [Candidatus Binatia bacterium]|nr:FtsQ-type POTRA domain-containing protein [Candidatus Binatia bacterium]